MSGRSNVPWRLLLAFFLGMAGCGGQGKPVKVEGVITLDGKPFSGATITFSPAGGNGRSASGLSEQDGSFRLTTFKPDDGALPGEYKIIVLFSEGDTTLSGSDPLTTMDNKSKMALFSRMSPEGRAEDKQRLKKARKVVPDVYTNLEKTPLKCTVPVDGKVELALKSTAR